MGASLGLVVTSSVAVLYDKYTLVVFLEYTILIYMRSIERYYSVE
jgi:hypothetical protein